MQGQGIRKVLCLGILGLTFLTVACSSTSTYTGYERDIITGKQLLRQGDYTEARSDFLKAAEREKRPEALALAATASYKLNDLPAVAQYIAEAERAGKLNFFYFRVTGYKALLLLQEGKKEEGLKTLGEYIQTYKRTFDSDTVSEVEFMWKRGTVDLPRLEMLIDRQVAEYENAMDQYSKTGTGGSIKQSYH
ncbi:MAG: hypothetical protein ABSC55_10225 [Syntrophorhabdales bacterium]|jgi:tetratricopeptide (TPR) repeat protein